MDIQLPFGGERFIANLTGKIVLVFLVTLLMHFQLAFKLKHLFAFLAFVT